MITNQLKAHFHTGEPVIQEYSALMNATFEYYRETRALFFEKLPDKLHQSELVSLINVDLKNRLFSQAFCETIQQALKALHRVIIRLEDLQADHPAVSEVFNNLDRLIKLAERVAALYQLHWELYRYQNKADEREMVAFLLEIDAIGKEWEKYQAGHTTIRALVEALSGRPPPENIQTLVVSYRRDGPAHFSTSTLKALLDFVDAGYRFVCAVQDTEPEANPLTLLQVEMSTPVELHLGVPKDLEDPLRRLLQYLFLKDMLRGETLLKFVCDAISKDFSGEKRASPSAVTAFQKELSAALKKLPPDGVFTISDRTFPDEGIPVLQEFTKYLEDKKIKSDALLKAKGTARGGAKTRAISAAKPPPEPGHEPTRLPENPSLLPSDSAKKEHIRILTERSQ
jgi:hypothetical protein